MAASSNTDLQVYINADIPELASSIKTRLKEDKNVDIEFNVLVQYLSDFVVDTRETYLELSKISPSFESIKGQMIAKLRQKPSWSILLQAGVGETLLEFIAAIGDYGQTSIQRAYEETSLDARLTSSIYTITRFLGVHIDRKVPATVNVNLWEDLDTPLLGAAIPSLSQWAINGVPFFNRTPIILNGATEDNPLAATLYQGRIQVESFVSTGSPFQYMEIGFNDYTVADKDVYCYINNNIEYKGITDGIWHYNKNDMVFSSQTTGNGNVEITFGNSVYGKIPSVNSLIAFVYALTDGEASNTSNTNLTVELIDTNDYVPDRIKTDTTNDLLDAKNKLRTIQGATTSAIFDGGDEKTKEFYAAVAPGIRASGGRAVTRPDHRALGLDFPKVVDVLFQGQKELNPTRPSFMNIVGVTVLTNSGLPLTNTEWLDYLNYLESIEIWRANVMRIDPTPVYFDVYGDIYCTKGSDLTNVSPYVEYNVNQFFTPQLGSLGRSVFETDAESMLKFKYGNMTVDYVQNVKPDYDTILTKTQFPMLRSFDCTVHYSPRNYSSVPPKVR